MRQEPASTLVFSSCPKFDDKIKKGPEGHAFRALAQWLSLWGIRNSRGQYARLHREKDAEGISKSTTTTGAASGECHRICIRIESEDARQRNLTSAGRLVAPLLVSTAIGLTLDDLEG